MAGWNQERLGPYVPRLVIRWLAETPDVLHRTVPGTVLFADISGFTQLTETLARRGKVGAEEMGDILNEVFGHVLEGAYRYGAGLVKWGGDAVLLLFDGEDHARRAVAAARAMLATIDVVGRIRTSSGPVRLGMSIGIHTGDVDFVLAGTRYRELIVTGPGASTVARMEKVADAGEIVLSPAAVAALAAEGLIVDGEPAGDGWRLGATAVDTAPWPIEIASPPAGVDLSTALPPAIRDHVHDGEVDSEHRQVAVGFLELAGTDALAAGAAGGLGEADGPAGSDALAMAVDDVVRRCQDAAAANGVTVLSTDLNADGAKVILISGAPRRAGDDETRVLTAIRTVLDGGGVLALRAGVTSGRVFAGDYGPPYRRNYSVAGDCVNLAARLMGAATPGQLLTTPDVVARTSGRFRARPVPPFAVKGKRDPIEAVDVVGLRERERFAAGGPPIVGRAMELAVLSAAVAEARAGRGQVVDVVGPAGIGKTRLLQELATRERCTTLWVDGDVYGDAAPYKPIRAFARHQLGLSPDAARSEVGQRFSVLVAELVPAMVPWLPLLGPAIDADFPMTEAVADLDVGARKERIEWAISELLGALYPDPTVLVFNDAHLMDDATVDLLRRLSADARGRPWVVVASYRPDERATVSDGAVLVELATLPDPAARQLATALCAAAPLPSHQLDAVLARAGGNPLFLGELITAVRGGQASADLPDSIEALITARIDRLSPSRRRLLRTASVIGMEIDLAVLRSVIERDDGGDAAPAVDGLRALEEFVVEAGVDRVQFRHHLVRDSAYEGLPYRRRSHLHAHTAAAIEQHAGPRTDEHADLLSIHCFHGARHADAWRYSLLAADRARAQYANVEAAEAYDRAIAAARRLRRAGRPGLLVAHEGLSDVAFELGEFDRAGRALRAALADPAVAPATRGRLCMKVGLVEESSGRYPSSLRWITKGLRSVADIEGTEARLVEGELTARYARVLHLQGRDRDALPWAQLAVERAQRTADDLTLAYALESLDRCQVALGQVVAEPPTLRSLAIYEEHHDLCGQARIHNSLGMRAYFVGQWPLALDHYRAAEAAYLRAGRTWSAATCQANIAEVLSDQGRPREARELLEPAMRVWRGIGAASEVSFGEYLLGRIAARTGDHDAAMALFDSARRFCESVGEHTEVQVIDSLRAEALLLADRPAEALRLADQLLAVAAAAPGLVTTVPPLHRVRGGALLQLGHVDEARAALRASVASAQEREAQHDVAFALDLLLRHDLATSTAEAEAWRATCDDLGTRLGLALTTAAPA